MMKYIVQTIDPESKKEEPYKIHSGRSAYGRTGGNWIDYDMVFVTLEAAQRKAKETIEFGIKSGVYTPEDVRIIQIVGEYETKFEASN